MSTLGNLFADLPSAGPTEQLHTLLERSGVRIERIVSNGHTSPPDFWYDQPDDEWVLIVRGYGELLLEGDEQPLRLETGDYLHIPARKRHKITYTPPDIQTIWLAIHLPDPEISMEN